MKNGKNSVSNSDIPKQSIPMNGSQSIDKGKSSVSNSDIPRQSIPSQNQMTKGMGEKNKVSNQDIPHTTIATPKDKNCSYNSINTNNTNNGGGY